MVSSKLLFPFAILALFTLPVISQEPASKSGQPTASQPLTSQASAVKKNRSSLTIAKNVPYAERESGPVFADLYRPEGEEILPVVLMIHGGAWIAGDKWNCIEHAREIASAGFVVMSINYRLAPKHPYPAQLDDCQEALRWLSRHHQTWNGDLQRLGIWGYSAGAHLGSLLALNPNPSLPKPRCCVAGGTPCDLAWVPEESRLLANVFGGTRKEVPDVYRDASPIHYASKDSPSCFFFHGTEDLIVPVSLSRSLHEKLRSLGAESELFELDGEGHLLTFINTEARKKAVAFLQAKLK